MPEPLGIPTTNSNGTDGQRGRVLLLSSSVALSTFVGGTLRLDRCTVRVQRDRATAIAAVRQWDPQVILVDVRQMGGALIAELGRTGESPRALLALADVVDRIARVELHRAGADAVVPLPCTAEELRAVVTSALRRVASDANHLGPFRRVGALRIDILGRTVQVDGRVERLTAHELAVLMVLAARPGSIVSPNRILDMVWGVEFVTETNVVERHISVLRAKLGESARRTRYIETVRGQGYRLTIEVAPPAERLDVPQA